MNASEEMMAAVKMAQRGMNLVWAYAPRAAMQVRELDTASMYYTDAAAYSARVDADIRDALATSRKGRAALARGEWA